MLKLHHKKIMTNKDLKENFNFTEILNEIEEFTQFKDFIIPINESEYMCKLLIKCINNIDDNWYHKQTATPRFETFNNRNDHKKIELSNKIAKKQWSNNKKQNVLYIILAIHYLSQVDLEDIINCIDYFNEEETIEQNNASKDIQVVKNNIVYKAIPLPNDNILISACYYIKIYTFTQTNYEIITKRYKNKVKSYGKTRIYILNNENNIVDTIELEYNEEITINTIDEQYIEKVKNISIGESHIIIKERINESTNNKLLRKNIISKEIFEYNTQKVSSITQFCADAGKGFVGIKDGEITPFTNTQFDGINNINHKISSIYINGYLYIALTVFGKVLTNNIDVKNWQNIISIHYSKDEAIYGITGTGKIISTNKQMEQIINSKGETKKAIYISAYGDNYFVKYSDGSVAMSIDNPSQSTITYGGCHKHGIILLSNNIIYMNNQAIKTNIKIMDIEVSGTYLVIETDHKDYRIYNIEDEPLQI